MSPWPTCGDGRSGRAAYEGDHLRGAVFVDLERWLSGEGGPSVGRHPLPDPATFATGMAQVPPSEWAVLSRSR